MNKMSNPLVSSPQEEKKVGVAKGEFGLLVSQGKTLG